MKLVIRSIKIFSSVLLLTIIFSCSVSASARKKKRRKASAPRVEVLHSAVTGALAQLIERGEKLLGRPYRYGGVSGWVLDCSGYVGYLYSTLGIKIPRSSAAISSYTKRIANPQAGDLLFFKGRNSRSSRVGHVALVVDGNNGDPIIMHSTNRRGIIKQRLSTSAYFSKRYLHAGRLSGIEHILKSQSDSTETNEPLPIDSLAQ